MDIGDVIYDAGFDVILHANNHALDRGKKGIVNTLNFWRTNYPNLDILGMYDNLKDSYYSLGNFINGTTATDALGNRYIGGLAEVVITKEDGKKAKISEYGVRALVNHRENKRYGSQVYELKEYKEELLKKHAMKKIHKGFSLKYCYDVCNKVWGNLWK